MPIFFEATMTATSLGTHERRGLAAVAIVIALLMSAPVHAETSAQDKLLAPFASALTAPQGELARSGAIYVPTYSHLPISGGHYNLDLSVTLSIRNTSPKQVMTVKRIEFFDTSGRMVQSYLTTPVGLRPYGTVNLFLPVLDRRGGSGGNFVVEWGGDADMPDPIVEAIMLGEFGGRSHSFVSRGGEIASPPQRR
jgi:hypothetical protein